MKKISNKSQFLGRWLLSPMLLVIFILLGFRAVAHVSLVHGCSMKPTIQEGDRLVVDRLSPSFGQIDRFDIVILGNPDNPDEDFVKRVVGLPGECIAFQNGRLTVNGRVVSEFFPKVIEFVPEQEWVVPQDHFFVLGDNRPVSLDSREFGVVPRGLLRGKVRYRLWPPARVGRLARE